MPNKRIFILTVILVLLVFSASVVLAKAPAANDSAVVSAQAAVGTGFTYQGYLRVNGNPANGQYDFQFRLYNDPNTGIQLGSTVTMEDVDVSGGTFTVVLDFGNFYAGQSTWLAIEVRSGASTGAYTTLAPRQAITPTPIALALPNVYTNPGVFFVGVGRSNQISGNEVFGVRAFTADNGYGGMYIEATSSTGRPFYGYAINGSFQAWSYYDGATGDVRIFNGDQDRLYISNNGFVGVNSAAPLTYETAFTVRRETSGTSYGGMYVETSDTQSMPFYGYATNGSARAWTYYEGTTGNWKLYNSGTKLTVQGNGNVGIGTTSPNSTLQVSGDYIQFPYRTGAPPAADCDSSSEYGRVVVRTDGSINLYVCTEAGWQGK